MSSRLERSYIHVWIRRPSIGGMCTAHTKIKFILPVLAKKCQPLETLDFYLAHPEPLTAPGNCWGHVLDGCALA